MSSPDSFQAAQRVRRPTPADTVVAIVGEGDPDASGPLNDALGAFRTDTVVAELLQLGVEPSRIVEASTATSPDGRAARCSSFHLPTPGTTR